MQGKKYAVVITEKTCESNWDKNTFMALLPAFNNGYVYARTYASNLKELLVNVEDLIEQEESYLLNKGQQLPTYIEVTSEGASEYLPLDELEADEAFVNTFVTTLP